MANDDTIAQVALMNLASQLIGHRTDVKRIEAAATGMDKIVNQPTMILAGEAGPEAVNITPLDSSPGAAGQQGAGVNINISGNVMSQEFVESELADKISEAVRRGTNFGLN